MWPEALSDLFGTKKTDKGSSSDSDSSDTTKKRKKAKKAKKKKWKKEKGKIQIIIILQLYPYNKFYWFIERKA